jgi:integral membrane protein (TIGR01906 family)
MPNWLTKMIQIAVALALPLVLLLGNIQLVAHERFVHYEYGRAGFPADTMVPAGGYALSKAERTALAETALQSITAAAGMRLLEEARFQETGAPAFNAREIGHMRDVRFIFQRARVVFWVALATLVGGGGVLTWRGGRSRVTRPLLVSVVATLSLAGALGLYILSSFQSFFTEFHHLFFEGDSWLFRQDDTLIRLFPTDFWFDAAVLIAGLTVVELVLVGVGAWGWGRQAQWIDLPASSAP